MARRQFICQSCGAVSPRWAGKCENCNEWNTLTEEKSTAPPQGRGKKAKGGSKIELTTLSSTAQEPLRLLTAIGELDRVLGGGFVAG